MTQTAAIRTLLAAAPLLAVLAWGCDRPQPTAVAASGDARASSTSTALASHDGATERYIAHLRPLNAHVTARAVTGVAELEVEGGVLTVHVEAKGLSPSATHFQHIHALERCPTAAADANGDHVVAFGEGAPFYGPVLIPLDDDISNGTSDTYPMSDAEGRISYSASTDVATLEAALGGPLDLEHRTIVIHGVPGPLPPTVAPPNPAALPVACGEITRE